MGRKRKEEGGVPVISVSVTSLPTPVISLPLLPIFTTVVTRQTSDLTGVGEIRPRSNFTNANFKFSLDQIHVEDEDDL